LDPDPDGDGRRRRAGNGDQHQGPARSLRRHPRRTGGRGNDGAGTCRPEAAAPGAMRMSQSTIVDVALGDRSYEIHIEDRLLDRAGALLAPLARDRRLIVISDELVWALQGERLAGALERGGITCEPIVLPAGEGTKSWAHLAGLIDRLLAHGVERS